jgi:outer membrane protein OmpA-like peptidoglycan-associated protein
MEVRNNMMRISRSMVVYSALMCCLLVGLGFGVSNGEKAKVKGVIATRTGETLIMNSEGQNVTVVLSDDTKVQQPKGLGLRKKQMSITVLIPGLRITAEGVGDEQNRVVAKSITFDADDLETAEAIQAGLTPTKHAVEANTQNIAANKQATQANSQAIQSNSQDIAANKAANQANQQAIAANQQQIEATTKRFSELTEYDTKVDLNVDFAVGKSIISADGKAALSNLAHDAVKMTGYIIQVKGFADSSGTAAMDQKLSMDRAQAVIVYLTENCNIPVRHIVAPGAMGKADPMASNESASGRAENRRVNVKVLVNKGLAG